MTIRSINPYDFSVNQEFEEYRNDHVLAALSRAEAAFAAWKKTSFETRRKLFLSCASLLLKQKQQLANTIVIEMGKPIAEAISEIEKCAMVCTYYAEHGEDFLSNEAAKTKAEKSFVTFQPLGCILAVMPWNFPFWQVFRFAAPTLMAGNVGLLKHASNVPLCSLAIEKVFKDSGFPEGTMQSLLVGASIIPGLIAHPVVVAVTLTGSEMAGAEVAAQAGKHLKKSVLELGGSDAFIVLADADIDKAAQMAAKSRLINNGQSCISAKRFIIVKNIFEEFVEKLSKEMLRVKVGNPLLESTEAGPMAREDLLLDLVEKVKQSVSLGSEAIIGGGRMDRSGAFMEPTILTGITKGMPAYSEEMFGPVASVLKAENMEEAIFIANDTNYGLGASVWTKNLHNAEAIANELEAGMIFANNLVASDPGLPFGGIKKSGFGRELGMYGIKEFVNIKAISLFN